MLVVADDDNVEHEYSSEYRGRVQDRKVSIELQPMYQLSYLKYNNGVKSYEAFDRQVDALNSRLKPTKEIFVACNPKNLDEKESKEYFSLIDSLSKRMSNTKTMAAESGFLLQRAIAYTVIQNFDDAIADLNAYIQVDSTSALAYWQKAVCQSMMNEFKASQGLGAQMKVMSIIVDMNKAIGINGQSAYMYYDRGNIYAQCKDYRRAIDDYNMAIRLDKNFAEAYYNRGLVHIYNNNNKAGIQDLSKAGELGLFTAYGVIKKYRK